ncbi:hypothetical protein [Kiloniella antarctica]|uniref:Uncharacterized protein n=1 Tax=Kiloniella antarctica TaxID=1550907 RepID=A0ABW5BM28_9PROT
MNKSTVFGLTFIALWALLGSPKKDLANFLFEDDAAPWEEVVAFYYPDASNLSKHQEVSGLSDASECRAVIRRLASHNDDPMVLRGDYECGIGRLESYGAMQVFRITTR